MSTDAKHTPGPWMENGTAIEQDDSHNGPTSVIAYVEAAHTKEYRANARLIAAAPEMYGILKDVLTISNLALEGAISPEDALGYLKTLASMNGPKAALAKAEGKA